MSMMESRSVDSIVTDPPYGLSFMNKGWDRGVPGPRYWREALRVAKPGAHLLAFGGTRTVHRLACAIEDAGWEIRDRVHWVYGSGFPKSLDVSKAIDKAAGAERGVVGRVRGRGSNSGEGRYNWNSPNDSVDRTHYNETMPATPAAQQWSGWGTALKPAVEPIILARKPFNGTVAANVLAHGTGAMNIEDCRVPGDDHAKMWDRPVSTNIGAAGNQYISNGKQQSIDISANKPTGRWPANLIHDGSDEATGGMGEFSRYFYCAKANKKDRGKNNKHPTVKPTDLMRYLCRLITPPGGIVMDPFAGSGSTGKAAIREGFVFIGIERDMESANVAKKRIYDEEKRRSETVT